MQEHDGGNGFRKDYSWQEDAVDYYRLNRADFYSEEVGKFEHAYVVEVSPSGGKSTFALKLARWVIENDLVDKVIVVAPRETIKTGFEDDAKLVEMSPAFQFLGSKTIRVDTDLKASYATMLGNVHVAVINYQSLVGMMGLFKLHAQAGLRLMFVFDEAHHGRATVDSDDDDDTCATEWGPAMEAVREVAHSILCMTGTPVRTDGARVPYLRYEEGDYLDPKAGEFRKAAYVKPDYKLSYKDAIDRGLARKLIFQAQDPTIHFTYTDKQERTLEYDGALSGVPRHLVDRAKRELFKPKNGLVDTVLKMASEDNAGDRKRGDAEAAILVVVGPTEGDFNPLRFVADRIQEVFGETPVAVESKDGDTARDAVRLFKKGTDRWIVSKDMITEGTSIPRIRQVVILRDIKSQVRFEQTVHRATRNRSDTVSQDAKVFLFCLPLMMKFVAAIEDSIRMLIEKPKPCCPQCDKELEFWPSRDRPCPYCGYRPPPPPPPPPGGDDRFTWLGGELDDEVVIQGGQDYTSVDYISRAILIKLGPNPVYGGRHPINEILLTGLQGGFFDLSGVKPQSPFSADEEMRKHWDQGMANCKSAAGKLSRGQNISFDEALFGVIGECKRRAGFPAGKNAKEKVMRDDPDARAKFERFYQVSMEALARASNRYGA